MNIYKIINSIFYHILSKMLSSLARSLLDYMIRDNRNKFAYHNYYITIPQNKIKI